jgi:hypothetical protein
LGSVADDGSTPAAPPAAEAAKTAPGVCDEKVLSDIMALLGGRKPTINYHPNEFLFQRHGRTSLHQLFAPNVIGSTLLTILAAPGCDVR